MDSKGLRELIATSNFPDWYNSKEIEVSYLLDQPTIKFQGFLAYYNYAYEQYQGWLKLDKIPDKLTASRDYFKKIMDEIVSLIQNTKEITRESGLQRRWETISIFKNSGVKAILTYDSPNTKFLLNLAKEKPAYFDGAYAFILGNHRTNNKNDFIGAMLAYEFESKGFSELANRRDKELESFKELKTNVIELTGDIDKQLTDELIDAKKMSAAHAKSIDSLINEKRQLYEEWFDGTDESPGIKDAYKEYIRKSTEKIRNLEEAYDEKLKLSKPARYWNLKSERYYKNFKTARLFLYILIGITALPLILILMIAPDYIFTNVFNGNEITIVRWSLILIAFLALMAFAIRAVARVMFSSLHLSRDAEERHALTFVYLSLLSENGSEMTEGDRKLVLQSLFSRSDTGLLKNDSGPTMPNDILNKLINKS